MSFAGQPTHQELDDGQVDHRLGGDLQVLVVLTESAEVAEPGKGPLHHPPSRNDREPWQHWRLDPWRQPAAVPSTIRALDDLEGDLGPRQGPGQELPR